VILGISPLRTEVNKVKTSTADRVRDFVVRNFAWIIVVQFVVLMLLLAVGGTIMMLTLRNLTVVGNKQLLANRAVVRCSLEETLEFDRFLSNRLGIPVTLASPNTAGIDCEAILRAELPPIETNDIVKHPTP
jgi:hypothetical protein